MSIFSDIDGVIRTSKNQAELETRLLEEFCLSPHDYLFSQAIKIYRDLNKEPTHA